MVICIWIKNEYYKSTALKFCNNTSIHCYQPIVFLQLHNNLLAAYVFINSLGKLDRSKPDRILNHSIQKVQRHTMGWIDLLISNWATFWSLQGADFWAPWKVNYFPLKVMTGFSRGGKQVHTSITNSFLGSCWNHWSPGMYMPSAVVYKPRFPTDILPLIKRKERYKPKGKKPMEWLGHNHKKADQIRAKGLLCGLENQ